MDQDAAAMFQRIHGSAFASERGKSHSGMLLHATQIMLQDTLLVLELEGEVFFLCFVDVWIGNMTDSEQIYIHSTKWQEKLRQLCNIVWPSFISFVPSQAAGIIVFFILFFSNKSFTK